VAALNAGDVASVFGVDLSAAAEARFASYYASQFPAWAFALACGMTIAWLYVWLRDRIPAGLLEQRALWAVLASVPFLAVVVYLTGLDAVDDPNQLNGLFANQPLLLSFAYPLVTAWAMLAFSLAPARVQRPLANEPMRGLADISYSVYLIHFAVIWFALQEFSIPTTGSLWSAVAWSALVFPVSIVYAWLSANLLERPIRRWANKYRRRGAAAPAKTEAEEAGAAAARAAGTGNPVKPGSEAPPVSIVLSTYNRPEWLRGAIDSVLAQDYPNLELLVVDDGSADETPRLLEQYAERNPEERFRFIRQENAGQARALNHGNERARGEILGYLSDDDLLAPGAVSRLAGELIADPGAAVAYPAYLTIDRDGVEIDTVLPIPYSPQAALRLHDTIIGPGALTRRWALESAGGWDPELRFMGDLILWMGVGLAGRAIRVAEPLASWRRHPGSATVQRNVGRAREHLSIVARGQALEGLEPLSRADFAEAIRNACLFGSLMCGEKEEWPERFAMFDLQPKRISAFGAGYGAGAAIDWDDVSENARLYRELVLLTVRRAEARARGAGGTDGAAPAGADAALARLREVGVLARADGSFAEGVGEWDMRLGLLEAALACGEEVDPQSMRFFLLDRDRVQLSETEQARVARLGYCCTVEELREAIAELTSGASAAAPEDSS
jgi:glycosyltransferase involved in cell wall biosynthesis